MATGQIIKEDYMEDNEYQNTFKPHIHSLAGLRFFCSVEQGCKKQKIADVELHICLQSQIFQIPPVYLCSPFPH